MTPRSIKSLRQYDSPADRIRQHRQVDKRPVLLTEGPSDRLLLEDVFDGKFAVFPTGSRGVALDAARRLKQWKTDSFACVVDRDFDDVVEAEEIEIPEIHAYENADLEAMLMQSTAFKRMVMELGSSEKLGSMGGFEVFKNLIHDLVSNISRLRRANYEEKWGLAFDEVAIASKVDRRTLKLNLNGYCMALRRTSESAPDVHILVEYALGDRKTKRQCKCPRGSSPYFRGRDALAIAGVALRSRAGTCDKSITEVEYLEKILRLAGDRVLATSPWGVDLVEKLGG